MNYDEKKLNEMWSDIEGKLRKIKILVGGRSRVGKSSTLNALLGKEVFKTDIVSCTRTNKEEIWESGVGDIIVVDVPGFGEADAPKLDNLGYKENVKMLAHDAHIFLMVLKADDGVTQSEIDFIREWENDKQLNKIPMIIIINQIDKIKPSRVWDPENLNLSNPSTDKEKNIVRFLDSTIEKYPLLKKYHDAESLLLVSAGEEPDDPKYGIDKLARAIHDQVPNALRVFWERANKSKETLSKEIIQYYSFACGGAAVQPIPIIDAFIIAPIQIAMIIHLGRIHKVSITKSCIVGLLNSIGLSVAGTYIFLEVVSLFPGFKQVIGPGVAYGLTYMTGRIVNDLFMSGNVNPSQEQIRALAKKYKEESKHASKDYEKTIARA